MPGDVYRFDGIRFVRWPSPPPGPAGNVFADRAGRLWVVARELVHPGEMLLKEFLEPLGVSQVEAAGRMNVPFERLDAIVTGRRGASGCVAPRSRRCADSLHARNSGVITLVTS